MLFAIVPAAPPTRKNQRTTSCPAPISAKVAYQRGSRLILSALEWVSIGSSFTGVQKRRLLPMFVYYSNIAATKDVRGLIALRKLIPLHLGVAARITSRK